MLGTIRTFEREMRRDIHERIRNTAVMIAQSGGAGADVTIDPGYPVTFNDPNLTQRMTPVLAAVVGKGHTEVIPLVTGAEDFSYYQQQVPGLYFFLGVTPHGTDAKKAPMCHSPRFYVDESAIAIGIRSLAHLAVASMAR
jgi:metal-dependent amidase/aminoacylase/carboxypeptidase family protein